MGVNDAGNDNRLVVRKSLGTFFGGKVIHDCADRHCTGPANRVAILVHGMTAEVEAGHLLFHRHALTGTVFLYIRDREAVLLAVVLRAALFPGAEEIHLAGNVVPGLPADAVDHTAGRRDQGLALITEGIEAASTDQVFDGTAIEVFAVHTAKKVFKTAEGTVYPPLRFQLGDSTAADAFDGGQTEADVSAGHGKAGLGLVHIRGKEGKPEVPAFGRVFGDLLPVVKDGGKERSHVFTGIVLLHISGAIGHDGIAHGVGLVEGVAGKVQDLVIDAVGDCLRDAVGNRTGDPALRVAVDESDTLGVDDGVFLLAHGAADHIGLAKGEARQLAENLDDLFLIHDAAIGDFEDRTEQRMLVGDMFGVLGALDKTRNTVHGARPVKGDDSRDVLDALRAQLDTDAGHACTFHLEDTHGLPGGEHLKDGRIILRHIFHAETGLLLADETGGVFEDGEVSQTEKVHLQEAQFLEGRHLVLADDGLVVLCQRNILLDGALCDHDAGRVGRGVPGHALQSTGHVDEGMELLVGVVEFFQRL